MPINRSFGEQYLPNTAGRVFIHKLQSNSRLTAILKSFGQQYTMNRLQCVCQLKTVKICLVAIIMEIEDRKILQNMSSRAKHMVKGYTIRERNSVILSLANSLQHNITPRVNR